MNPQLEADAHDTTILSIVELVVVHGMGRQRKTETLVEWAEPLTRRMDWLTSQPGSGLNFGRVILDPAASDEVTGTSSYVDLNGVPRQLSLRITEALWSDSFLAMKRGETFTWGMSFMWRAALRLALYAGRVMVVLGIWRVLGLFKLSHQSNTTIWTWVLRAVGVIVLGIDAVVSAVGVVVIWAVLAGTATVVFVFLLFGGLLLFLPVFSRLLGSTVDAIVEFVGDVAVWTRRPVRAAAMQQVVRDAVDAANCRLEKEAAGKKNIRTKVVVLAHSQGAAISAETLFSHRDGKVPPLVDALVTVGAAVTLLGSSRWADGLSGAIHRASVKLGGSASAASLFDPVGDWSDLAKPVRWLNFWGIWDPAAAGPISTGNAARRARWRESYRAHLALSPGGVPVVSDSDGSKWNAKGPEEHAVHNTSSPFTDHQSYSGNIVQVIDPVARVLLDLEPEARDGGEGPVDVTIGNIPSLRENSLRRNRLHVRGVKALGLHRLLVLLLAACFAFHPGPFRVLGGFLEQAIPWLFGLSKDEAEKNGVWTWLIEQPWLAPTLLAIALTAFGLWTNEALWRYHSRKLTWRDDDELVRLPWVGGIVLRLALIVLVWVALGIATVFPLLFVLASAGLSVVLLFAPRIGQAPLVVPARR